MEKRTKLLAIIISGILIYTSVGCITSEEITPEDNQPISEIPILPDKKITSEQKFEIVSCFLYEETDANLSGDVLNRTIYFHFGYIDNNGEVIFNAIPFNNSINLKVTSQKNSYYTIKATNVGKPICTFYLTRDMYKNLKINSPK